MKIGILTMPLASNYGGTLQNYALQTVLKRLGHDSITLRFPSMYQNRSFFESAKLYVNLLLRHIAKRAIGRNANRPLTPSEWRHNTANFESFIRRVINVTDYINTITIKDCVQYGIDVLLVGSDQIWRPEVPYVLDRYFCRFASNSDIPRISYAASLALDDWTFSSEQTNEIKSLLKKFSHVSVREKSGVELLKENAKCDAEWVIDPTMLLTKQDYLQLIDKMPHKADRFIFAYILDQNQDKTSTINKFAQAKGLKVYYLNDKASDSTASIERWLSYFRDSDFVITDSFHGTVFSILFEKQFICYENPHRGNARIDSLKELTGLSDRFISKEAPITDTNIDYSSVGDRVERMRSISIDYLQKCLKEL